MADSCGCESAFTNFRFLSMNFVMLQKGDVERERDDLPRLASVDDGIKDGMLSEGRKNEFAAEVRRIKAKEEDERQSGNQKAFRDIDRMTAQSQFVGAGGKHRDPLPEQSKRAPAATGGRPMGASLSEDTGMVLKDIDEILEALDEHFEAKHLEKDENDNEDQDDSFEAEHAPPHKKLKTEPSDGDSGDKEISFEPHLQRLLRNLRRREAEGKLLIERCDAILARIRAAQAADEEMEM